MAVDRPDRGSEQSDLASGAQDAPDESESTESPDHAAADWSHLTDEERRHLDAECAYYRASFEEFSAAQLERISAIPGNENLVAFCGLEAIAPAEAPPAAVEADVALLRQQYDDVIQAQIEFAQALWDQEYLFRQDDFGPDFDAATDRAVELEGTILPQLKETYRQTAALFTADELEAEGLFSEVSVSALADAFDSVWSDPANLQAIDALDE